MGILMMLRISVDLYITYQLISMGSCCVQKEKDQEFAFEESSLTIANGRAFPTLSLLFSQQRPSKLKGECAIVFLSSLSL